jgi:predicted amidohydrolase
MRLFTAFVLLCCFVPVFGVSGGEPSLGVLAVQLEIDEEMYRDIEGFINRIEALLSEPVDRYSPDLVIFPEYTGVFLALTQYSDIIESSHSFLEAFEKIRSGAEDIGSLKDLFVYKADAIEAVQDAVWGELARRYSINLLSGSYFAYDKDTEKLTNRTLLYNPDGKRVYFQDKIYLTEFERDIIALDSGGLSAVRHYTINGLKVGFSICRDTFFPVWNDIHSGADLWIDIKANGEKYTAETVELFERAIPARMKGSSVENGLTVCLTGEFLDLFWEGESSFYTLDNGQPSKQSASSTVTGNDVLFIEVN